MDINLDVICDYLPKSLKIQRFGPANKNLSLKFPIIYEAGCEFEKDRLYIARPNTLPKIPPVKKLTVVCVDQYPPQKWMNTNCQLLMVTNCPSLFFVFNEINKIYEKFNKWERRLRDELETEKDFDIKKILKMGTMIMENPISVANGTMLTILSTKIATSVSSPGYEIVENDKIEAVTGEMIKDACRLERIIKEPYISSVIIEGKRSYCNNLYPFGYFSGCISITETNRPFRDSDFFLADQFYTVFQKAYAKYLRSIPPVESLGANALRNILSGIPLSTDEQKELTLNERDTWICFRLKNTGKTNYLPIEYMCTSLNTLMSWKVYAIVDEDEILGLLKNQGHKQNPLEIIVGYLSKMEYIAGVSNEFTNINQISSYIKQADYAVSTGSQICADNQIYYFRDFTLQYLLTRYDGTFPLECLYSKGLNALFEHDRDHNTEYIETLDAYLKNKMSITDTANELFLHRSSLLNRLEKIKKLMEEDLEDPDIRLYLRSCLYLWRKGV